MANAENLARAELPEGWVLVPAHMTEALKLALDEVNALREEAVRWMAHYLGLAAMWTKRADAIRAWLEGVVDASTRKRLLERMSDYQLRADVAKERSDVMRLWIDEIGKAGAALVALVGES